ncbi:hypothetical protein Q3G72_023210 [Acer saccharum]|nr:hypothetical protein Q3G72_023210 [Acer saccharum]
MAKVEIDNYEEKKYTKSAWLVERRSREVLVWLKKEVGKSVIKQQNDKTHKADKRNSHRNQIIDFPLTFKFVPFANLDTHKDGATQVDIIAIAIDMQPAHQIRTKQGPSTIQELIVINKELKPMVLTMWNQFVDNEAAHIFQLIKTRPIILAAHLKSSFIINPDTSEAIALHSWSVLNESILEDIFKNKSYIASASSSAPPVIEDVVQFAKIETLLAKNLMVVFFGLKEVFWFCCIMYIGLSVETMVLYGRRP